MATTMIPMASTSAATETISIYAYIRGFQEFDTSYVGAIVVVLQIALGWGMRNVAGGRAVYATGSNEQAARLAGLDTAKVTFAVFAYVMGRVDTSAYLNIFYLRNSGELTVFCSAIFGACVGFLWYNSHPAEVFMGDTGSLALGGALGAVAILLKSEFLLLIVGAVFVAETLSVILQRSVFKYRRRRYGLEYAQQHRVFRRAPLHHHFELKGWHESQVVIRFWIIGILCAFLAFSSLMIR